MRVEPDHDLTHLLSRPVLLAVDDYQALYCSTNYRDQQFAGIKSYHLSIPRLLLEFASGKRYFVRPPCLASAASQLTLCALS